jgi:lysophospholipase L1-like esterase
MQTRQVEEGGMERKGFREAAFRLALAGGSLLLCLVVAEVLLALLVPNRYYVLPPDFEITLTPHEKHIPGVKGHSLFRTNSLGMRGDEMPRGAAVRILAVGGSSTECGYLDHRETWPYLLQTKLNERAKDGRVYWVGNVGRSGFSSRDHILEVKHLLHQHPEIDTVMVLVGANDLLQRLSRGGAYDPAFSLRQDFEDRQGTTTFFRQPLSWSPGNTALKTLIVRAINRYRLERDKDHIVDPEGVAYRVWREHRQGASEILEGLPLLESALRGYERNLNRIADYAGQRSVRLIYLTQPALWNAALTTEEERLLWMGGVGDYQREPGRAYYSAQALARGLERYNNVLRDIGAERAIEVVDLARIVARDTTSFYDDLHLTERGAVVVSEALASYLLSNRH